jgi:zinc protease
VKSIFVAVMAVGAVLAQPAPVAAPPKPAPVKKSAWNTLKFPPLREVKIPDITPFTLSNGMKVFLLPNHELPVVSGFALIRTGNLFDPKDKIGLADMTGDVMRTGGTKSKTGEELNLQLENIAASVEANIGETNGRVAFNCLKENTDEVLAAFYDVLTAPEFRQDKIDLAKTQQKSSIARRNDNAMGIAGREFSDILYGRNTPYGWQMQYETVDRVTRQDMVAFHQRYFFPKNVILAIYGDFDEAAMRSKLEKQFAAWTVQQPPVPEFPKVNTAAHPGVFFAAKDDVNQTTFRIGHLSGILKDKDYPALEVMGSVLGGSPFTSRLGSAIRVQRGYAYSIGAFWGANYTHPGTFAIAGSTKSETTVPALQTIQAEIEKFRSAPPTAAELKTAKDKILNAFVFNFDSPSKTLGRLVNYEYWGYPKDFIFQYQKAVEAVTPADVQRVAKEYLKPENFTYVLVGKTGDIKPPLSALNMPVSKIDLTIPEPKKATAASDATSLAKGSDLLKKMVAALGGADKIAAIKDYVQGVDLEIQGPQGPMQAKQTTKWMAPQTIRQDLVLPMGTMSNFYDGKSGWIKTPQGEAPLAGPILKQRQHQLFRNLLNLSKLASKPGVANYIGDGVVEVSDGGLSTRVVIDEATGMPKKQVYQADGPGGPAEAEEEYGSFLESGGVKFPQKITFQQGGKIATKASVSSVNVNTGATAAELAKKP